MKKAKLIINVEQELFPDQIKILNEHYDMFERVNIPSKKLTKSEVADMVTSLNKSGDDIVIRSTLPILMSELQKQNVKFKVFHNECRKKKVLQSGKIIYPVARYGWELI